MTDNTEQQAAPGSAVSGTTEAIIFQDVTTREELEQLYEESLKHIQEGEIVRGRVVHIGVIRCSWTLAINRKG